MNTTTMPAIRIDRNKTLGEEPGTGHNRWHTHVEIPDPIPAGTKLWVEIEAEGGTKGVCSFDPKAASTESAV